MRHSKNVTGTGNRAQQLNGQCQPTQVHITMV